MTYSRLVVVAPDKFKHTLTAAEATDIISAVVMGRCHDVRVRKCPMADGGEATSSILGRILGYRKTVVKGYDCLMRPVEVECHVAADKSEAIVDSSGVIGLQMISTGDRDPWMATSWPLGDIVNKLIESGVGHVTVGVGGTATVDCGLGFLQALGCGIFTSEGRLDRQLRAGDLLSVTRVELPATFPSVSGVSDVDVPLLDDDDRISMLSFAAQKGVTGEELVVLKKSVENIVENVSWRPQVDFGCRFGGAGGGLGFALKGVMKADVTGGAEAVAGAWGIFNGIEMPSLVITGEGSYDRQSIRGKVTGTLRQMCRCHGVECVVIAGRVCDNLESDDVISTVVPRHLDRDSAADALREAVDRYLSRSMI